MQVKPIRPDLLSYAKKHGIQRKLAKQITLFSTNAHHPSLHTELLEPKNLKVYSFRIDIKYRAIFIMITSDEAEIIDVNDHYR